MGEEGKEGLHMLGHQIVNFANHTVTFLTLVTATWPRKLTFIMSRDTSRDIHSNGPAVPIPALFTSAYISRHRPDTACTKWFSSVLSRNCMREHHGYGVLSWNCMREHHGYASCFTWTARATLVSFVMSRSKG